MSFSIFPKNFEHNEPDNSGHGTDSGYGVASARVVVEIRKPGLAGYCSFFRFARPQAFRASQAHSTLLHRIEVPKPLTFAEGFLFVPLAGERKEVRRLWAWVFLDAKFERQCGNERRKGRPQNKDDCTDDYGRGSMPDWDREGH